MGVASVGPGTAVPAGGAAQGDLRRPEVTPGDDGAVHLWIVC